MVIGCVPYLNAKPLVEWFHTPEGEASGITVRYDVPSRLAQMVETGEVACALVSSVELFRHADWVAVPRVAIASTGKVLSVRLFSKVPLHQVRSVALDTSSLTSSALVRILFARWWKGAPEYLPAQPDLQTMLQRADAALLIGDRGMFAPDEGLYVADLGEEWHRWTGLPFVWALWLGREEHVTPALVEALQQAKGWGEEHLEQIVQREAQRLGKHEDLIRHYLREVMQYEMTPAHEAALERFAEECLRLGLIPFSYVKQAAGSASRL
ncbi:MAG: menaquinone biosynthesis protein [Armatimonadota bacterium]|nr:menaquinone biosynthesis protein [Armatimonadota bacterium]